MVQAINNLRVSHMVPEALMSASVVFDARCTRSLAPSACVPILSPSAAFSSSFTCNAPCRTARSIKVHSTKTRFSISKNIEFEVSHADGSSWCLRFPSTILTTTSTKTCSKTCTPHKSHNFYVHPTPHAPPPNRQQWTFHINPLTDIFCYS